MTANNIPTGVPDPGDVQEMKTCPECKGKNDIEAVCCTCNDYGEITEQEYANYKVEQKQDEQANE